MHLATLFSTPIAMHEHPGLDSMNRELTEILVAESTTVPSLSHSNIGGWHSRYDLQTRPEPCFRKVTELIIARVRETTEAIAKGMGRKLPPSTIKADMWAMVMRDGNYTLPHAHPDSHWASVYYVDAGDADKKAFPDSGDISFMDPRNCHLPIPGIDVMTTGNFVVDPKAGQLLVFPGWLLHFVHAYRGQRPRVCLACNVTFKI